ncbi:MAG: PTS mannitol transporter subunit IICBA [Rothia sp. (in: high G+C Gram-positive bacteria)]|nr:PTS mannitol transporter subunit IICBA [Rothia sp. (in: high G+C Gram-positive bacteria)]
MSENNVERTPIRVRVQKLGTFLSSMIMPNIGAFIAWGLITALFIPKGFFPNEKIGSMVDPMVFYLLPILIAYTGGKLIYEHRGGVVGATATMGVILGTSAEVFVGADGAKSPMFLGAMIMGPLAAWCMKKLDGLWADKIKPGFEMLINNFSAGIFAAIAAIASMFLLTPVMNFISHVAKICVEFLVHNHLLPLTSILIEPAKVLFLNNAINHGIITPLATQESLESGKSILYLLEANPGPGLGILLAYMIFGTGTARATAPGAALIHFVGGIHEIYFPYVLMKPQLILAAIAGGMSGIAVESMFDAGLRSPAAPGSIIAILASTASDSYLGVIFGVLAATLVSFLVAALILRFSKKEDEDLAAAAEKMQAMKGKKSSVAGAFASADSNKQINKIVFACDAGMGSSAMGASVLRNKIKDAGFGNDVTVVNSAINNLKDEFDLLVSHQDLADRAARPTPSANHVAVDNFMSSPRYDEIVEMIREQRTGGGNTATPGAATTDETREEVVASGVAGSAADQKAVPAASGAASVAAGSTVAGATSADAATDAQPKRQILSADSIKLDATATDRDNAIEQAGQLLVATGSVDNSYVAAMHEREASVSTFMGNGLAIPHGTNEAKSAIHKSAMSFIRFAQPVDWKGKPVTFAIGIAGADGEHLELLQKVAKIFSNKASVAQLEEAKTAQEVLDIFGKVQ